MSGDVVYLEVVALRGAFRRAGFAFTEVPQVVECTPAQAAAIRAEDGVSLKVKDTKPGAAPVVVTLASLDARIAELGSENAAIRKANDDAQARFVELDELLASRASRIAELEAQNKHLSAVSETNASELAKAHEAGRVLAARAAELEAQLAKANADLDALAAPKVDAKPEAKPEAEAPKGKPAKG